MDPIAALAMLIPITALMIPIVAIWTAHKRQVLEMQLRLRQSSDASVSDEMRQLREQITDLRDTTTRYDMSFDTALQRMESTVAAFDRRLTAVEREGQVRASTQN